MATLVVAVLLWLSLLVRLVGYGRRAEHRAVNVTLGLLALAVTLDVGAVGRWVAMTLGVANVEYLAKHVVIVLAAASATAVVQQIASDRTGQAAPGLLRRLLGTAPIAVLLGLLFAAGHPSAGTSDFTALYVTDDVLLAYGAVWYAALGVALVRVVRLAGRQATAAQSHWVRPSMLMVAAGGSLGLGYIGLKVAFLTFRRLGADGDVVLGVLPMVAKGSMMAGVLLLAGGLLLPVWHSAPALRGWHDERAIQRLHPLWRELTTAVPHIVLDDRTGMAARDRLQRTVVEIHDAALTVVTDRSALAGRAGHLRALAAEIIHGGARTGVHLEAEVRRLVLLTSDGRHRRGTTGSPVEPEAA